MPVAGALGEHALAIFTGLVVARTAEHALTVPTSVVHLRDIGVTVPPAEALDRLELPDDGEVARCRLRPADVVVTARGAAVRAAVISDAQAGAVAGPNVMVVRPRAYVASELLATFLRHPDTAAALLRTRAGSATGGFTATQLAALPIGLPTPERQAQLADLARLATDHFDVVVRAASLRRDATLDLIVAELQTAHTAFTARRGIPHAG